MAYQIVIARKSKITKVDQVVLAIRSDIEKGVLLSGSQIPSITVFARRIGISRDMVEKAYNRLKEDSYLESVPTRGCYVSQMTGQPKIEQTKQEKNMEEFDAKLFTELKGIKALLAKLMGSSDLPVKECFSKPDNPLILKRRISLK